MRVASDADAAEATRLAREMALGAGLTTTAAVQLATAVSEIAVNQLRHAGGGTIELRVDLDAVRVEARDGGPGIPDPELALRDGWSSAGSLGLGLPGARRLVDAFELDAPAGGGTRVRMAKFRAEAAAGFDPGRVAEWVVAGPPAGAPRPYSAFVQRTASGVLLAVAPVRALAVLREDPAAAPSRLVDHCGGRDVVVAAFEARDGHLSWQAAPAASALVRRGSGGQVAEVARAPQRRGSMLPVLRGDEIVLASFPLEAAGALPAPALRDRAPAATPGPVILVARLRRGALERRL